MFTWLRTLIGLPTDSFTESKITTDMILSILTEEWSTKETIKEKLLVLFSDELIDNDVDDLTIQSPLTTLVTSGLVRRSLQKVDGQHTNIYRLRSDHTEATPDGFIDV